MKANGKSPTGKLASYVHTIGSIVGRRATAVGKTGLCSLVLYPWVLGTKVARPVVQTVCGNGKDMVR